jgi:hypothetical protein
MNLIAIWLLHRLSLDHNTTFSQFALRASMSIHSSARSVAAPSAPQGALTAALVYFAREVGDYEKVVRYYIGQRMYKDAISLLDEASLEKGKRFIM